MPAIGCLLFVVYHLLEKRAGLLSCDNGHAYTLKQSSCCTCCSRSLLPVKKTSQQAAESGNTPLRREGEFYVLSYATQITATTMFEVCLYLFSRPQSILQPFGKLDDLVHPGGLVFWERFPCHLHLVREKFCFPFRDRVSTPVLWGTFIVRSLQTQWIAENTNALLCIACISPE